MSDEPTSFIKTPKQLAIVVLLAFAVPIALIVLMSQLVTGVAPVGDSDVQVSVAARIKPVGELVLADAVAPAAPAPAASAAKAAATPAAAPAAAPVAAAAPAPSGPVAALDLKSGEAMLQKYGCTGCHGVDKKIVGPAYIDVAAKYRGDKDAVAKLMQKVKGGGSGVWGAIPMPPNPQVPDADLKALVSWILTLKK
jgi:cytochrome c